MSLSLSKILKDDMIKRLEENGVQIPSTKLTKQQLYELAPHLFEGDKKEPKVEAKKEPKVEPKKVEVARGVGAPKAIATANYGKRLIVVVQDPEEEGNFLCRGHYLNCRNFAFEKSTGTSNEESFRNVFLPILRTNSAWLAKDSGLSRIAVGIIKIIIDQLRRDRHSSECILDSAFFLSYFLDRFGCWKQLQISAALSGDEKDSTWNVILVANKLKEFALTHNLVDLERELEFGDLYAKQHFELDDSFKPPEVSAKVAEYKDMLSQNTAKIKSKKEKHFDYTGSKELFFSLLNNPEGRTTTVKGQRLFNKKYATSRIGNAKFFVYERDVAIPKIEYKTLDPAPLLSEAELNAWLDSESALCAKYHLKRDGKTMRNPTEDDIARDTAKNKKDSATAAQVEERKSDIEGFFSGWKLC